MSQFLTDYGHGTEKRVWYIIDEKSSRAGPVERLSLIFFSGDPFVCAGWRHIVVDTRVGVDFRAKTGINKYA